jgi:hypothetical protein
MTEESEFDFRQGQEIFLLSTDSRLPVGTHSASYQMDTRSSLCGYDCLWVPTQHPIKWIPGALYLDAKRRKHEGNHELVYEWRCVSQPIHLNNMVHIKHMESLNLSLPLFLFVWLYSPLDLSCYFCFLILYTIGRTPWTGDQPVARLIPTHRTTQTQNKRRQTSMPRVGFESIIQVFERAKTVHALDRTATVIGTLTSTLLIIYV